jgi:uncharacterized protein (TIGR02453 family)
MTAIADFSFPVDTIAFLTDLRSHNDKAWFDSNRGRYEAAYVEPAKAFVEAVAPGLRRLVPAIRAEPKVMGSIFRINRDTRFSNDKRPYKDHLDLWFWEGDRRSAVSGLYLRISPDGVLVGAGAHGFGKDQLACYRDAVVADRAGRELIDVVDRLDQAGHQVGGETYTRTPRGYSADGVAARLLRHSALYADVELPAALATDPDLVPTLMRYWDVFAPVHRWLTSKLAPS